VDALFSPESARAMTHGDGRAIGTTFYLVGVQITFKKTNGLLSKGAFHLPHAATAEIQLHITMAIVFFFTKFIEPTVNKWRNTALLGADCGVFGL
jgi:hypothetical protein